LKENAMNYILQNNARCHEAIFKNLQKRCQDTKEAKLLIEGNAEQFILSFGEKKVGFQTNIQNQTVLLSYDGIKDFVELSNEHLVGLIEPHLLFDFFDILNEIRKNCNNIRLINNHLKILNCDMSSTSFNLLNVLDKLDSVFALKGFTLQCVNGNFFR
jgi:hypothetical protein